MIYRGVEIPCQTCPTWSQFIQDKLEISFYLSWDKYKESKYNSVVHILIHYPVYRYHELTCCRENSVDPDQLASSEAS